MDHDHHTAGENTSGTDTSYSAADKQSDRIRGCAANKGAELERANGGQEYPFGRVELVYSTIEKLGRAACKHVRADVPANIVQRVELVGDPRDGRGQGCSVL